MKIKTYTGFVDGTEIRDVYSDGIYKIIRTYLDDKPHDFYRVVEVSSEFEVLGLASSFELALNLIYATTWRSLPKIYRKILKQTFKQIS